jgi:hypothetical protein
MPATLLTLPVEIRQMIWTFAMSGEYSCRPDLARHKKDGWYTSNWKSVPSSEVDLLGCQNPRLPLLLTCKVVNQETKYLPHDFIFNVGHDRTLQTFFYKLQDYPTWNRSILLKLRRLRSFCDMSVVNLKASDVETYPPEVYAQEFAKNLQRHWYYQITYLSEGIDVEVKVLDADSSPLHAPLAPYGSTDLKTCILELYLTEKQGGIWKGANHVSRGMHTLSSHTDGADALIHPQVMTSSRKQSCRATASSMKSAAELDGLLHGKRRSMVPRSL